MSNKNERFSYTYSAQQQAEVQKIREKYLPQEEDKMEQLRRLDGSAAKPGKIAALILGIVSALVTGVGMCCTMVWADKLFIPGIIIGFIGLCGMGAATPLYRYMTKKRRDKIAPEIMRLTEELSRP
jgi:hypothetical protein